MISYLEMLQEDALSGVSYSKETDLLFVKFNNSLENAYKFFISVFDDSVPLDFSLIEKILNENIFVSYLKDDALKITLLTEFEISSFKLKKKENESFQPIALFVFELKTFFLPTDLFEIFLDHCLKDLFNKIKK